jgi:hypothetical protein
MFYKIGLWFCFAPNVSQVHHAFFSSDVLNFVVLVLKVDKNKFDWP